MAIHIVSGTSYQKPEMQSEKPYIAPPPYRPPIPFPQRLKGNFLSNTVVDPNEHCNAIKLRSGTSYEGPKMANLKDDMDEVTKTTPPKDASSFSKEKNEKGKELCKSQPPCCSSIPFPQRLQRKNMEEQFSKFLEIFKKIHINIPLVEALQQMPKYAKFLKDVILKKKKLKDFEIVHLNEECSAILQRKLPAKMKDPGSFTIPCAIGGKYFENALCDLGASINLMPLSIFNKLGIGTIKSTSMALQMADRSITHPKGIVEDMLVKVGDFIFPVDFVVLDMEEDKDIPLILGRPFLATGKAMIDVANGELTLRVNDESHTFSIYRPIQFNEDNCGKSYEEYQVLKGDSHIDIGDYYSSKELVENCCVDDGHLGLFEIDAFEKMHTCGRPPLHYPP